MCAIFTVVVLSSVAAPVPPDWALPKEEGERYVARLKELLSDGWTVSLRGSEVTVQRDKPVQFARVLPNAGPGAPGVAVKPDLREGTYRFVFRFRPKLSLAEYDRQRATNAETTREIERLGAALGLRGKFGEFLATTPEEKARLKDYQEKVAQLPRYDLPELYTPDHSVLLFLPADGFSYVHDDNVRAECQDMEQTLLRYFGMYNPRAAARGEGHGRYQD